MQNKELTTKRVSLWLFDLALILGVCLLLFFRAIGDTPFYDKQEAREALVIWEIHQSGDWILPLRNGREIPAKPPFYHWLGALASTIAGTVDELTARLPSAVLGTLGVVLTYAAGVFLWGRCAGLIAALVLSTSFEWRAARQARVDMALTFVLLCSFLFFLYLYRNRGGRPKAILLGLFLGLAALAKGPLGIVLPTLTFLIFLWRKRDFAFLRELHPITVVITCAVVAGSWYSLALWQGGREFLFMVIKENFGTVVGKDAGHPHPFWWYVPYLFQRMAPWSLFFPGLGLFLYQERHRLAEKELLYFVVWAATVLTFFSIFSQKRTVYILSAYPAIALLFGAWWQDLSGKDVSDRPLFIITRLAGYLVAGSFIILSAMLIFQFTNHEPLGYFASSLTEKDQADLAHIADLLTKDRMAIFIWAGLCGLGGVLSVVAVRKNMWRGFMGCTAVLMVVSLANVQNLDTELARQYSYRPFMRRVVAIVKDHPLFFYHSEDYTVLFYAGRHIHRFRAQAASVPFYILLWQKEWNSVQNKAALAVLDTSENTDKENPKRGHLLLVRVEKPEAFVPETKQRLTQSEKESRGDF